MTGLKNDYIHIQSGHTVTYGGSQTLSGKKAIRDCGCGLVAAADLILYLSRRQGFASPVAENAGGSYELSSYNAFLDLLRRYMPIIPRFGINGAVLAAGLQIALRTHGLKHSVRLCISGVKLWDRVRFMLEKDYPVILAIGPNLPMFWGKNGLKLYSRRIDGGYSPAAHAKAHFVTATGIDGDWCRISSWGRELYINIPEYNAYVKKHSSSLVSNIIMLSEK